MHVLLKRNNAATNMRTFNKIIITADSQELYKVISVCNKEISKYNQYIYFIGTSLDNIKLRNKIRKLTEKLFKNLIYQKEFIKKCVSGQAITGDDKNLLIQKIVCFTLTALSCVENILTKLSLLLKQFPVINNGTDLVVNLGFEDSTENALEDITAHREDSMAMSTASQIDDKSQKQKLENELNFNDLSNKIDYIQSIKDEVEQLDAYQIRYNLNSESQEFFKNVKAQDNECEEVLSKNPSSYDANFMLILRPKNCIRKRVVCALSATFVSIILCTTIIFIIIFSFK